MSQATLTERPQYDATLFSTHHLDGTKQLIPVHTASRVYTKPLSRVVKQ